MIPLWRGRRAPFCDLSLSARDRVSRSAGQSSVASAAYILRAKFTDERTGQICVFGRGKADIIVLRVNRLQRAFQNIPGRCLAGLQLRL